MKKHIIHYPMPSGFKGKFSWVEFTFSKSLCGAHVTSSALNLELVNCEKCLKILDEQEK